LPGVNTAGNQDTSGTAADATVLETARTIGGTSFNGSANIAVALSATATALATARAINGTDFDGTAAITVTAAAGTLTGATLNSGVTASSLTSVGTLTSVTTSGDVIIGTNPASSGDIRIHKNFGILARNQDNDGDMYVLTSGHITGNDATSGLASLELGSNSADTWAAIRFHAGAANCMIITPTTVAIHKDLTIPTATFAQNLPTSSAGLASGRMWVDSGTVKVIA